MLAALAAAACAAADVEPYAAPDLSWFDTWFAREYAPAPGTRKLQQNGVGFWYATRDQCCACSLACRRCWAANGPAEALMHTLARPGPRLRGTAGRRRARSLSSAPESSGASPPPASSARRRTNSGCAPRPALSRCALECADGLAQDIASLCHRRAYGVCCGSPCARIACRHPDGVMLAIADLHWVPHLQLRQEAPFKIRGRQPVCSPGWIVSFRRKCACLPGQLLSETR